MRRRDFTTVLAGAAVYPLCAGARQKPMPVIGFLGAGSPNAPLVAAFRRGLSEAGYVEGRNLAIEYRWAEGHFDRLPALAADLVGRKVDVILAVGGVSALAAKTATSTIPIVFLVGRDPVEFGLVDSLSRPGGNLTGFNDLLVELTPKRLELLSDLVPQVGAIAVLVNPTNSNAERIMTDVQEAARAKGVQLHILKAGTESEIDAAEPVKAHRVRVPIIAPGESGPVGLASRLSMRKPAAGSSASAAARRMPGRPACSPASG
jgi:putative tryptophan/tyrosine transport system substrate-binding protein